MDDLIELRQIMNRRHFMCASAGAGIAALLGGAPRELRAEGARKIEPKADTLILLWMAGGMAQTETFDPEAIHALRDRDGVERGSQSRFRRSTRPSTTSRSPKGWNNIAKVMDRGTLIRSTRAGDLGFILALAASVPLAHRLCAAADRGRAAHRRGHLPHAGAAQSGRAGVHRHRPEFRNRGESEALKAFHTAGFLGSEYGPFLIADPRDAAASVRPPAGSAGSRFQKRYEFYRKLVDEEPDRRIRQRLPAGIAAAVAGERAPAAEFAGGQGVRSFAGAEESLRQIQHRAVRLGCLLARRLTEAGARFIEVTTEYIPFRLLGHARKRPQRGRRHEEDDRRPVAQLVLDLEERGLLNRTLMVLASEFGRDMMMEGKPDKRVKDQVVAARRHDRAEALRDAPPFHGSLQRADVRRRHQEGSSLRQDRGRAALQDRGESGDDRGPARHHLPRAWGFPRTWLTKWRSGHSTSQRTARESR